MSWHSGVSRGRSWSISVNATAALRTGTRAASTASASSPLHGLAIASVTRTSAAAPPAAYDGAHWRTHPAGDAASEALTSPAGQALVQHPDLQGTDQPLDLVEVTEHRPQPSDPAWCNRPMTRRNTDALAATAAQSSPKQVPSMNPT